jgi:hypothetical protein
MKINKRELKDLIRIKLRLESVNEKTDSSPAKGDETPSVYYRHISEQLLRMGGK